MDLRNQPIIIYGLGAPALFLLRQLVKITPHIYCLYRDHDIGRYSRYGIKYRGETSNEIEKRTLTISQLANEKPVAFLTSEFYIAMIKNNDNIIKHIDIVGPPLEWYNIFTDKRKMYEYASSFGINTPKSYSFSNKNEIIDVKFPYPLIIKWGLLENSTEHGVYIQKTKIIIGENELERVIKSISDQELKYLIFQPYYDASEYSEYSYGGYYEGNDEIMGIVTRAERQFPLGIYSFVKESENDNITQMVKNYVYTIIKDIEYNGFLEVEFMVSEATNEIYLIDFNPRIWGFASILKAKYPEFCEVFRSNNKHLAPKNKKVRWFNPFRDAARMVSQFKNGYKFSIFNDIRDYRIKNSMYDIISLKDYRPTLGAFKKINRTTV